MPLADPFTQLLQEHEQIAEAVGRARGATEAAALYGDTGLVPVMIGELRSLQAFMARDLAAHIAQEEEALFPAYLELSRDRRLVEELTVQHDRVREQRELLEGVLHALDHRHDEVEATIGTMAQDLEAAARGVTPDVQERLLTGVRQLDWLLQGHFDDEEADLFEPGEVLFSGERLEGLAAAIEAVRQRFV